jgi:ATP-dependent DNA helicase RecQ
VESLETILRRVWGYDQFRPLQAEAMQCVLAGRDSVVVLPTGGGKSLCFQAPALAMPGLAVVVSPLISLMKDQVDTLVDNGVAAASVNSTLDASERREIAERIRREELKLLYLSPERLMTPRTLDFLRTINISFFAVDEAHCISDWGHDFRPEYRMLRQLKELFPQVGVHGYTATATERVRHDIARELQLREPEILVGSFDRPNLIYRIERRGDLVRQVREVIDRHRDDSGIIYCIRRADVESLAANLAAAGYAALPYHAGLDDQVRRNNQDDFLNDRVRIIVATVAFGMGIDKSDVRYVIHTGAPKSLEQFQQESGRAGRDGLEAECCLFYTGGDFGIWRKMQSELPPEAYKVALQVLRGIEDFCGGVTCRHRAIVEYFGQTFESENCQACDVCLSEIDVIDDPLVIGKKILSSVLRQGEAYGAEYTALVLTGSREQRILDSGHDQLSTWGLLKDEGKRAVRDWIEQLTGQGFLERAGDDAKFQVLKVTTAGRRLLRGEVAPRLLKPQVKEKREGRVSTVSWEGVDRGLFEVLRAWRRKRAEARGLPPFVVFSDATLRSLARHRPSTPERLLDVHGIGQAKAADYGAEVLEKIAEYCRPNGLPRDVFDVPPPRRQPATSDVSGSAAKHEAMRLFRQGRSVADVCQAVGRSRSTVSDYLAEMIVAEEISDPTFWIDAHSFARIRAAAARCGLDRLKPLYEALEGTVTYEDLRIAAACLRNAPPTP